MNFPEKYTYDDLLLVPRYSTIDSIKGEVSTLHAVGSVSMGIPIISAAMTTVTETLMQTGMRQLGGLGIHHRYFQSINVNTSHELRDRILSSFFFGAQAVSPSMWHDAVASAMLEDAIGEYYIKNNDTQPIVKVDVAHGDRDEVYLFTEWLKKCGATVWSANIATVGAANIYSRILTPGVDALTVGVGPGSACSTRVVSGVGYPQASAIYEIKQAHPEFDIIADGGIKSSGDIVKALALGASAVIIGGLLAGTDEAPGEVTYLYDTGNGHDEPIEEAYKVFEGMASKSALTKAGKTVRAEGVSGHVPYVGSVEDVINDLVNGIKTGMAYVGARTIPELQQEAEFIKVTQNGVVEGQARI